jgi:formylglycine-generating enzyme required for sulfatase activity
MFLAAIVQPATPQQTPEPLSKNQVMTLVKAGMETPDLVKLIHEHGIDFDLTDDYLQALGKAGAQEPVIQALRAARPKPLTQEQVLELVAGHVPSERAAMLVKQHDIDFLPDEEYLKTLRLAGADDTLIAAVREASAAATGELTVATSPDSEVYLDGELQGRANAQGEFTLQAKPGAHMLKVSLKGKKDFEQSVTLAAPQSTKVQVRLVDIGPSPGTVRENVKDGLKYVWIPPGTFMMGCSPGDSECGENEKPSHQVTITRGFWMGQTEVTVGAYKRFAAATGRQVPPEPNFAGNLLNLRWGDDTMPVVDETWDEAQAYCSWAGGRLPTEAEWEFAAGAGSTTARYGDRDEIAWYVANSGRQHLDSNRIGIAGQADYNQRLAENGNGMHEVGQKRANGLGLYDMLGNVWEWVNDWYDASYYKNSPSQDPAGLTSGALRTLRSGSWYDVPINIRVSERNAIPPASIVDTVGFRCGREVFAP